MDCPLLYCISTCRSCLFSPLSANCLADGNDRNQALETIRPKGNVLSTLRFLINVLDQISVLVGNFVKINKHTGPNKHTGAKLLAQKYNFL